MIVKNVYILSHGRNIVLVTSNFKLVHNFLVENRKNLGIIKIQAYNTLVAKVRKREHIFFDTTKSNPFFVEQRVVARKKKHIDKLINLPF